MKNRLLVFLKTKTGKTFSGIIIIFILTTSAYGTAVQVMNFPSLMAMIQKMVTQAIVDKIGTVWNETEMAKIS